MNDIRLKVEADEVVKDVSLFCFDPLIVSVFHVLLAVYGVEVLGILYD